MNRLFEIQTLSDQQYSRLSQLEFIPGIIALIPGLFPNLLGSERTSREVFNKLFPSNGYWTSQYKNYLLSKIKYIKDIERDLHMYTGEFIQMNQSQICQGKTGQGCWENFYKLIQQEAVTGGQSPVGNIFGAGLDYQTLLLVGGGVLLLLALSKKKKSRKK